MEALEDLRVKVAAPFIITSGYRCPEHPIEQRKVKGNDGVVLSPHTHGAVDIHANRALAARIVAFAVVNGFTGIGMRQHGKDVQRFVHLDRIRRTPDGCPIFWTYSSVDGPREGDLRTSPENKPIG